MKKTPISKTKVLNTIREIWELYPEMSLGEFLTTFVPGDYLSVIDDNDLIKILEELGDPIDGEA
jgi:hypothetical protein